MVCYARPAGRMAVVVLVVLLVFGRRVGHFFDAAALTLAITVAVGVAVVAAAVAHAAFLSVRRRRAASGGCVSCQLRCQHAMTEQPRRLVVVSTAERGPGVSQRGQGVSERGPAAPRWPDRPAYRSERRERAGSAVLPEAVASRSKARSGGQDAGRQLFAPQPGEPRDGERGVGEHGRGPGGEGQRQDQPRRRRPRSGPPRNTRDRSAASRPGPSPRAG
jgi:hypothetical protein